MGSQQLCYLWWLNYFIWLLIILCLSLNFSKCCLDIYLWIQSILHIFLWQYFHTMEITILWFFIYLSFDFVSIFAHIWIWNFSWVFWVSWYIYIFWKKPIVLLDYTNIYVSVRHFYFVLHCLWDKQSNLFIF